MKKQLSLSRLLHNDKLMMILSLVLAVIIWVLVVYGPGNTEERVITGVPVSITLNDYATQTLKLRITEGASATATVKVRGLRSTISALTPQDITITADTGNVISEGTYTLPLRAVSEGDYTITSVVGDDGTNDTVTISCDSWREAVWAVEVEMPNLSVSDTTQYQFDTPSVSGAAVMDGTVTVSGPKGDINRIKHVVAVIDTTATISETTVYEATLQARDEQGKRIDTVSFVKAEDGKVSVTVPVMVYRKVKLAPTAQHVPAGYKNKKNLVTITPSQIELWGVPSEIDDYIEEIQAKVAVDFDHLTGDTLKRQINLDPVDGIRPVNGSETIIVKVALSGISSKTVEVPVSAKNFKVTNCPEGYTVTTTQTKLTGVTLYGPASALKKIDTAAIQVVVDMGGTAATGQQTVKARLSVTGQNTVWVGYDVDISGIDVLVSVEEKK